MTEPHDVVGEGSGPAEPPRRGGGKKTLVIVLIIILAFLVVCGAIIGIYAWRFTSDYQNLSISPVDISQLPNGTYLGSWKIFHVDVSVSVAVKDHQIVAIDVLDAGTAGNSGRGQANLEILYRAASLRNKPCRWTR